MVRLNRAVAMSRVPGADPSQALALVEQLAADPAMAAYPWLPSVRGDLLERLARRGEAREAFAEAARRAGNAADRALMQSRAEALAPAREGG